MTDGRRVTRDRASVRTCGTIALLPLGDIDLKEIQALAPTLGSTFERATFVAEAVALPQSAYHARRRQYVSTVLLDILDHERRPEWDRVLGVVDVDLFAGHLNFVFGEADAHAGVAVTSLARLHDADVAVFRRRAETEAIHELGHTYGLGHCGDPRCVMWFSNTLVETDRKGTRFCAAHACDLARILR